MGTPDFSVPTLTEIVGRGHEVAAVYTRVPKARGRGMALQPSPVHAVADRFGNPVPEPLPEAVAADGPAITLVSRERGTYELRYVPPPASADHLSELNVRVGEALGRGSIPLLRRRSVLLVHHDKARAGGRRGLRRQGRRDHRPEAEHGPAAQGGTELRWVALRSE